MEVQSWPSAILPGCASISYISSLYTDSKESRRESGMPIELDACKLVQNNLTITVDFKRMPELRLRLWIGLQLLRLFSLVTGIGIEVVD